MLIINTFDLYLNICQAGPLHFPPFSPDSPYICKVGRAAGAARLSDRSGLPAYAGNLVPVVSIFFILLMMLSAHDGRLWLHSHSVICDLCWLRGSKDEVLGVSTVEDVAVHMWSLLGFSHEPVTNPTGYSLQQ